MENNQSKLSGNTKTTTGEHWPAGGATGLDMDEGEIFNGVIGGIGSELDKISEENAQKIFEEIKQTSKTEEDASDEFEGGPPY